MIKKYLKCDISEGMSSTQKSVKFYDIYGNEVSGKFPNESFENGKLEIGVVGYGNGNSLIYSPEGFQGKCCFRVNNELLIDS